MNAGSEEHIIYQEDQLYQLEQQYLQSLSPNYQNNNNQPETKLYHKNNGASPNNSLRNQKQGQPITVTSTSQISQMQRVQTGGPGTGSPQEYSSYSNYASYVQNQQPDHLPAHSPTGSSQPGRATPTRYGGAPEENPYRGGPPSRGDYDRGYPPPVTHADNDSYGDYSDAGGRYILPDNDPYADEHPGPDMDRFGRPPFDDRMRQTPSPSGHQPGPYGDHAPYAPDYPHEELPESQDPGYYYGDRPNVNSNNIDHRKDYAPEEEYLHEAPPPNAAMHGYDRDPDAWSPYDSFQREAPVAYDQDLPLNAPPPMGSYGQQSPRRSPSMASYNRDQKWRNPDLPEVIDFLSHPSNAIKANAAAYLQHLCYMDDNMKAKARSLNAIPPLVDLVRNDIPEVHRAACGALRNLSYGRANDDNKKAIKNSGGIQALVRLLRNTQSNDVRELVTGIMWNLSSCQDLKRPIIDEGLVVLVDRVIIPHSGWRRNMDSEQHNHDVHWSTVFRNASGVLRNVSSDGEYARRKLRECEGLCDGILFIVRAAIGKIDIDNKSVENCVCILRNLSYACEEVRDPSYLKRRAAPLKPGSEKESVGCFGGNKKKKDALRADQSGRGDASDAKYQMGSQRSSPVQGMELLWQPDVVKVYLPLLKDCSNPETLEAAAGAIQNLAACDWGPSQEIRVEVRKEKGLPIIVELLTIEADRVVCAAATALRNLALDNRNKELIGKYAMHHLVMKLPLDNRPHEFPVSEDTITAVQATLYEVIRSNAEFALALLNQNGVDRLVYITQSRAKYSSKIVKFAASILFAMWQFKEWHVEYKNKGWKEHHFVTRTMAAKGGPSPTANNTLNRPRMDLGGPHQHYATDPSHANHQPSQPVNNHYSHQNNPGYTEDHHANNGRDHIPMSNIPELPSPSYAAVEHNSHPQQHDYRPAGGVPLFPNLPPQNNHASPQSDTREPVYAQVYKPSKRRNDQHLALDGGQPDGGADSWV